MNRIFLGSAASLVLSLAAGCTAEAPVSGDDQNLTQAQDQKSVGGFDFDGYTTGLTPAGPEICPEIVDAVGGACHEAGGEATAVENCRTICSVPVAPVGKVAGFDFGGFRIVTVSDFAQFCPAVVDELPGVCEDAGGKWVAANCDSLCSVPVAPNGSIAGYDFSGPHIVPELQAATACPEVLSAENVACGEAGGILHVGKDCRELCSKPIASHR